VFSPEDVDFLEQFNPPAYKIASADRAFAAFVKIAESEMHNLTCGACGRALAETSAWKGSGERFYCNDFCAEAEEDDSADHYGQTSLLVGSRSGAERR
jgi:hypothetical protein